MEGVQKRGRGRFWIVLLPKVPLWLCRYLYFVLLNTERAWYPGRSVICCVRNWYLYLSLPGPEESWDRLSPDDEPAQRYQLEHNPTESSGWGQARKQPRVNQLELTWLYCDKLWSKLGVIERMCWNVMHTSYLDSWDWAWSRLRQRDLRNQLNQLTN